MQLDRRALLGLLLCGLVSLALRTILVADEVFVNGEVRFQENDPWYHVRLIDNTVRYFPHRIAHDPWAVAPDGHAVPVAPLFDQAVAALALVFTLGRPSDHAVHVVAALVPALFGALIVLPVYVIGRVCWGRNVGLVAAGLIAITPGVFLDRTRLGYVDHHVAESLFATLAVMALVLAARAAERVGPRLCGDGPGAARAVVWRSLLFGLFLACYLLSWIGGFLLVGLILVWIVVQVVSDHLRGRPAGRVAIAALPGLALALGLVLPYHAALPLFRMHVTALVIAIAVTIAITAVSLFTERSRHRRSLFAALCGVGALLALALLQAVAQEVVAAPIDLLLRSFAPGAGLEVAEVQPLLARSDVGWTRAVLLEFTTGALLGLGGIVVVARSVALRGDARHSLVLVWSILMIAATLMQVRFAYYSAVNVALLTAVACRAVWRWAARPVPGAHGRFGDFVTRAALVVVAFGPGVLQAPKVAGHYSGPDADWLEVLRWMREETPSPFGEPDTYYGRFEPPASGRGSDCPGAAWSVMNWWDYGYWILTEARRVPTSIPTQAGATESARFYLAQSESEANAILDRLRSRYVLVDATLPLLNPEGTNLTTGKFKSMAVWAGRRPEEFFEAYYWEQASGGLSERYLYYPEYFRSMLVRLFLFEGRAAPAAPVVPVVSFVERADASGVVRKVVAGWREFATYEEARDWVAAQEWPANHRVVSGNPQSSCIPLESLARYRLVHRSATAVGSRAGGPIAYVQLFEFGKSVGAPVTGP